MSYSGRRKKEEGKDNAFIRKAITCPEISMRLLFMCHSPELSSWPLLIVKESERADISGDHFGVISKTDVLIVKRRSMDSSQQPLLHLAHNKLSTVGISCRRHSVFVCSVGLNHHAAFLVQVTIISCYGESLLTDLPASILASLQSISH